MNDRITQLTATVTSLQQQITDSKTSFTATNATFDNLTVNNLTDCGGDLQLNGLVLATSGDVLINPGTLSCAFSSVVGSTITNTSSRPVPQSKGLINDKGTGDSTDSSTNTSVGTGALTVANGNNNTSVGYNSLKADNGGVGNCALGSNALTANTSGNNNNAVGYGSLSLNTLYSNNNAFGYNAFSNLNTGGNNLALGDGAANLVKNSNYNVFIGSNDGSSYNRKQKYIVMSDGAGNVKQVYDTNGNAYLGATSSTSMTNGFYYIPSAAGVPTGVPTIITGQVPMYYDSANNILFIYSGYWKACPFYF